MESLRPKSAHQVLEETNRIGVQFLLTDLTTALTFLDLAESSLPSETRQRNRTLARTAYDTVLRLLPRVSPSDEERIALEAKLFELRTRLNASGHLSENAVNSPDKERSEPG